MRGNYCEYVERKNTKTKEIVKKIENKEINISELEDNIINDLICYYTKELCLKKKKINNMREKIIKKGEK